MRHALFVIARLWRRLWCTACEVAGIAACLVLIALFLPLVPVFKAFEALREACEEEP